MPTTGSLFSGVGLLDLGLEWAGFDTAWQVEWDAFRRGLLGQRFPWAAQFADVHDVDFSTLPSVDLIAGGFPCTPASAAGKRLGRADPRWLWPEFARAVRDLRPRHVLVENVPRLLAPYRDAEGHWQPALIEDVIGDLDALGYVGEWDCVPAAAVGAPHERDRVWILATNADISGSGVAEPSQREGQSDSRERRSVVADAEGLRRADGHGQPGGASAPTQPERRSRAVADADREGRRQLRQPATRLGRSLADRDGAAVADAAGPRRTVLSGRDAHAELAGLRSSRGRSWWATEPDVGRVAHGSTSRLDRPRLRALGDGVVTYVGYFAGRRLMQLREGQP